MSATFSSHGPTLRVIQCFRAPIGGLFRHVCDLTRGLAARGVEVGIVCDRDDRNNLEGDRLTALASNCSLGIHRLAMPRAPGFKDLATVIRLSRLITRLDADIIHGHGAKGGAYARLVTGLTKASPVYTPHGGSLHFTTLRPDHVIYRGMERILNRSGGAIVFESEFAATAYAQRIGSPPAAAGVVHNGLSKDEFAPVQQASDAVDVLFIGEFREIKGINVLIDALARIAQRRAAQHQKVSGLFVGSGPDESAIRQHIATVGLTDAIRLSPPMPARDAFVHARLMVVPSFAESLPYVVLEAGAAGMPLVATTVGGIPEILGPDAGRLVAPRDPVALAEAIEKALRDPAAARADAERLQQRIATRFTVESMVGSILDIYRSLLAPNSTLTARSLIKPSA